MVFPVGIGLPTGVVRSSLVGRSVYWATSACASARPELPAALVALPEAGVVVAAAAVADEELLLFPPQAAATCPPITRTVASRRVLRRPHRVCFCMVRVLLLGWARSGGRADRGAGWDVPVAGLGAPTLRARSATLRAGATHLETGQGESGDEDDTGEDVLGPLVDLGQTQ